MPHPRRKLIFTSVNFAQWLQPYNICKHSIQSHVFISERCPEFLKHGIGNPAFMFARRLIDRISYGDWEIQNLDWIGRPRIFLRGLPKQ